MNEEYWKGDFTMTKVQVANELKLAAEEIMAADNMLAADTFKCPSCGTKVLEQTGYCVKCKKKVKKWAWTPHNKADIVAPLNTQS